MAIQIPTAKVVTVILQTKAAIFGQLNVVSIVVRVHKVELRRYVVAITRTITCQLLPQRKIIQVSLTITIHIGIGK